MDKYEYFQTSLTRRSERFTDVVQEAKKVFTQVRVYSTVLLLNLHVMIIAKLAVGCVYIELI